MSCAMGQGATLCMVYEPQPRASAAVAFDGRPSSLPTDQLSLAPMPRHVWFHPEPMRLARQGSIARLRRGACTEKQLFPGPGLAKPTGLDLATDPCPWLALAWRRPQRPSRLHAVEQHL